MLVSRPDVETKEIVEYPIEDRFIKLPFENLLAVHGVSQETPNGIEPIPPQIALINAINSPKYRFVVAALSRRTGKTFISNLIAHAITLIPGSNVLVMAPNYSLSSISWDEQRRIIKEFGIEVARSNGKDRILELENGSMVRMGSISQADSVVGRSYDLILFDECALDDNGQDVFNVQLRPTLDKPNSKAIFISTPRGLNWFKEFYDRGWSDDPAWKRWASIKSNVEDNPRADMEDVEDARRSMSKAKFEQEYYCDFTVQQGLIWELNRACIMEIEPGEDWDVIAGLDIGFRDATAMVVVLTDGYNFYVVDEYLATEKATSKHAEIIKEKYDAWEIDFAYIDHSAAQTKYDLAYDYDISTTNANKSKLDGIGYVASIVDWDRLFISPSCVHTIDAINNYRWDLRPGKIKEEPVHDDYSHISDALRYALYSYAPNMENISGL